MAELRWGEIWSRAGEFATEWAGETYEKGESQTFWTKLLEVYGIDRRRVGGVFEFSTKEAEQGARVRRPVLAGEADRRAEVGGAEPGRRGEAGGRVHVSDGGR